MSTLHEEIKALRAAEKRVIDCLKRDYPVGSVWGVKLRHGQKNWTEMKVSGHPGGVYGTVSFFKEREIKDRWGKYQYPMRKDVSIDRIMERIS